MNIAHLYAFALIITSIQNKVSGQDRFGFENLQQKAWQLAQEKYQPPLSDLPETLTHLTYDQIRDIRFDPSHNLWKNSSLSFRVSFFHRTVSVPEPVQIYLCEKDRVTPVPYSEDYFTFGRTISNQLLASKPLPPELGYAGLRVHFPINNQNYFDEFLVFLGASYFRSVGKNQTYGLSARGLAINAGISGLSEEFPRFTTFWLRLPSPNSKNLTVYALLDSTSVCGAYQFEITPGEETKMSVHSSLYFRQSVEHLGIAPLTSMFWYGENSPNHFGDYRPEVHDSDGALLASGQGEWIWNPLQHVENNLDQNFNDIPIRGFGLMQRDRNFQHYEDLEAFYHLRPSAWISPRNEWGKGKVRLIQMPSQDETNDNVLLYWEPTRAPKKGDRFNFNYDILWTAEEIAPLARCFQTLIDYDTKKEPSPRFLLDFVGSSLRMSPRDELPQAHISTELSASRIEYQIMPNPYDHSFRVSFLVPPIKPLPGHQSVELRCQLFLHKKPISEIWLYNWFPSEPPSEPLQNIVPNRVERLTGK